MDWVALLQENGLPVVCILALGFVAWFLLKRILSNHETDRQVWKEAMDKHNTIAETSLLKLTEAIGSLATCLNTHDTNNSNQHQRIVDALNHLDRDS